MNIKNYKHLLLFIFAFASFTVSAKDDDSKNSDLPFKKGTKLIGLSIGASIDNYFNKLKPHPVPALIYDQGIFNDVGIGNIGVGGVVACKFLHNTYDWGFPVHANNYYIGIRGTYHFTILKNKDPKFDPYAGIMLGVKITRSEDTWYKDYYTRAYLAKGIFIGARYILDDRFSAFTELGYNISFISLGIFVRL